MRFPSLRPIPVLLTLASLTLVACDEATDPAVTGPGKSLPSVEAPIPITACGTVITQPGVYEMAVAFGNAPDPAPGCPQPIIDIRVSNVTVLGGQGYVDGHGGAPCLTAGVAVPGGVSHIRLIGLDLRACSGGAIVFENVSASVVEQSTIWFNGGAGIAIKGSPALSRADTVRNSSFSDNGLGGVTVTSGGDFSDFIVSDNDFDNSSSSSSCGITMTGSHSIIRRNTFSGNCGLEVTGNRNTIVSNAMQGLREVGIRIMGQRNVIIENSIRRSSTGIENLGAYNTFRGNTVEDGYYGIRQEGNAVIVGNTVQNNQKDGIWVNGWTRVNGNRVLNNGKAGEGDEAGIHVFGNLGAVIAENTVLNNSVLDLLDEGDCGANTWRRNTFGTASASCIQ
jgi:hypothetical protein